MAINFSNAYDWSTGGYTYDGTAWFSILLHGIHGQSFTSGTDELLVAFARRIFKYNSDSSWTKQTPSLTSSNDVYFDSFIDYCFFVNGVDANYSYDGTTWSTTTNVSDSPIAHYIKEKDNRLYLYDILIGGVAYRSRVWMSDLPKNNGITWGLETGSDLAQAASSGVITSAGSTFITNNIKIGDPIIILDDDNAGEYTVQSVDSETQLTLTETLANTETLSTFWVGGNWFDVAYDDGDYGMGIGETSNQLFFFKKNSVYRYDNNEKILRKVKTAPGTTSPRSIVGWGSYVYWFNPSGIYRTEGTAEEKISDAIEDIIAGMNAANNSKVVGWVNPTEDTINMFLGSVTTRDGDTINNCVAVFDINSNNWSLKSYPIEMTATTTWMVNDELKIYATDSTRGVHQIETGTDYNGVAIPFGLELQPVFPAGTGAIVTFNRVRAYINNGPDVQIFYKLIYKPTSNEDNWINDQDWHPLLGSQKGERSEWYFPRRNNRASGVKLKVVESSTNESFLLQKLEIYYSEAANR